jgi:hypothetical protein
MVLAPFTLNMQAGQNTVTGSHGSVVELYTMKMYGDS